MNENHLKNHKNNIFKWWNIQNILPLSPSVEKTLDLDLDHDGTLQQD